MSSDQATVLKTYLPPAGLVAQAAVSGMAGYEALCAEAERDYEGYWARLARELIVDGGLFSATPTWEPH